MEQPPSPSHRPLSRRTALKLGLTGLVGVAVGASTPGVIARLGRPALPRCIFLTADEAALLADMCEQLIPGDDTPGATDAGVVHYIDLQLSGVYRRHQSTYRRGLAAFAQTCRQQHGAAFAELPVARKLEALRALEAGRVPPELWGKPSPQAFFNLVLAHTMQGFYGSPRHGGNRGYASYRMLGLDYPPVTGRNRPPKA
ncbi:MAG TPA: gluconate 2-dehydrogenase subunit 3 family protein [Lacunisphaera sp.]|nr:gluconate 2-dehydrogenase subunit 3 family protein [Lacunisphaera sp.]